jgi:hypothetical protein
MKLSKMGIRTLISETRLPAKTEIKALFFPKN